MKVSNSSSHGLTTIVTPSSHKGVGKGRGGQILSSCYYVYKQLPQKDVQNLEKQEEKTAFIQVISSVTHTKIKA